MTRYCDICDLQFAHEHRDWIAPNGEPRTAIVSLVEDPRAEVRDSETGEMIFPAVKGPLTVIEGGKP